VIAGWTLAIVVVLGIIVSILHTIYYLGVVTSTLYNKNDKNNI